MFILLGLELYVLCRCLCVCFLQLWYNWKILIERQKKRKIKATSHTAMSQENLKNGKFSIYSSLYSCFVSYLFLARIQQCISGTLSSFTFLVPNLFENHVLTRSSLLACQPIFVITVQSSLTFLFVWRDRAECTRKIQVTLSVSSYIFVYWSILTPRKRIPIGKWKGIDGDTIVVSLQLNKQCPSQAKITAFYA